MKEIIYAICVGSFCYALIGALETSQTKHGQLVLMEKMEKMVRGAVMAKMVVGISAVEGVTAATPTSSSMVQGIRSDFRIFNLS